MFVLVDRVFFFFLVLVDILFGGWDVVFVGVVVRVAVLFNFELGGFPSFCFLGFGSSYVGCIGCIASDVGLFRVRLRLVYGGGMMFW